MFAVACASGVALAVTFSEPALVVPPEPLPTNARVLPFTRASGWRIVIVMAPPEPPPAEACAVSNDVAEMVTAPEPTCAPPMPASVEAPDVTSAFATPNAMAIRRS